jgi:hypothetical protein
VKTKAKRSLFLCQGSGLTECSTAATSMCTSCSRLLCDKCDNTHKGQETCNLIDVEELGNAWWWLATNRVHTTHEGMQDILTLLPVGRCVRGTIKFPQTELRSTIASYIREMQFPKGAEYVRTKYLYSVPRKAKPSQTQVSCPVVRYRRSSTATTSATDTATVGTCCT